MQNRRVPSLRGLFLVFCAVQWQGCAAIGSTQTADTVGAGRLQVGVEPGVTALLPRTSTQTSSLTPLIDVSVRYGAAERLDLGVRAGQSGLGLETKVMLTPREWPVLVSLAPALTATLAPSGEPVSIAGSLFSAALPLLIGVRLGPHQVVLGPRAQGFVFLPTDGARLPFRALMAGGSLGVALRLSRAVAVMPELALLMPLAQGGDVPAMGVGVPLQVKLGFLLGEPMPLFTAVHTP
ncbi:MAG: hypothetical protein GQE15_14940 [Archangiaceae bacterium]|nr:hypothetical protein [Archangiaceae bacterium]